MKFETRLNKIMAIKDCELRKLKLISLAFKCIPSSPQQNKVKEIIYGSITINLET